ncbi:MAG TPA: VWA domain-containing protein [Pyrinomonadaceae bacterium]|nr:VWA domain-containing protein [Pyrinomonadaceae bacterium]
MYRHRLNCLFIAVIAAFACVSINAQEVEDTIRIKTRVVFLDALVKDKKTNLPISNLTQENFEVFDDGKPRPISYFTREGQARKPLALILIMDVREDGAGRFLKQTEIVKTMENELAKLPPGDEVAILAVNIGEDEDRVWLSEFTNERTKIGSALARLQQICEKPDAPLPETTAQKPAEKSENGGDPKEVVATETFKGRNGAVVTRTTMRDGTVSVKRVSKNGEVTVDIGDIYDMSAAVRDATQKAQALRPNSQLSLVWVSDGIAPMFFEERDATEQILIRDNVIFNSLTVELRTLFKFLLPIGKPIAGWVGLSLYGSAKHLAQRSGGEAVKVGRVKDYGAGLSRIIGNLTARYSLGFTLAENETDDGRMHGLEVRVKAKDEKGKTRKLQVSSRQGYYMAYPPITQKQ